MDWLPFRRKHKMWKGSWLILSTIFVPVTVSPGWFSECWQFDCLITVHSYCHSRYKTYKKITWLCKPQRKLNFLMHSIFPRCNVSGMEGESFEGFYSSLTSFCVFFLLSLSYWHYSCLSAYLLYTFIIISGEQHVDNFCTLKISNF